MINAPSARFHAPPQIFLTDMKSYPLTTFLCLLALAIPSAADTFIMKDGSKLQGRIVSEDATTYLLEVEFRKSIKDERKVAKADVVRIDREKPVQDDFKAIGALLPVPDLTPAAEYAKRMRTVEKYLAEHRMTAKFKDAEAILATLKAEASDIQAGAIKLNGKIIPLAEYRTNQYDIDARIQELKIRKLVKDAHYLPALRAFDNFQKDFANTLACHDLLPLISQVVTSYVADTASILATYDARIKNRKLGLDRMTAADRRITEAALSAEAAELEKRLKTEKDAKVSWVTLHPFCKPALEDTVTFGKQEQVRLATLMKTPVVDGGKAFRDAMSLIQGKGDSAEAKTAITAAIAACKTALVPQRYITALEASVPGGVAPSNN